MYYFLYTCFPVLTKSEMASLLRRSSVLTCQIVQKCTSRNISSTVQTVYKHKSRQLFSPGGVTRNLCGSKHVILSQTLTKNCNCRGLQTEGNSHGHLFLVKKIYLDYQKQVPVVTMYKHMRLISFRLVFRRNFLSVLQNFFGILISTRLMRLRLRVTMHFIDQSDLNFTTQVGFKMLTG